ncbi:MAG TPA: resolvase [Rhodospirillaceae bacterium]|nr:resolvase [Rhodospirillaceae bacterium]|tara:strand:+ start:5598 stop:6284 length:687 start_codon:yes stop_codon:yes gene_type:complete
MPQPHFGKFVAYFRVSTDRQGRSGLGLEAQEQAVREYLNGGDWQLVATYTEVETGKNDDRPQLNKALRACRAHGATLVVAKLDRLARNAHFLLGLEKAGVEFICCDMPNANRLTVGIMAMVAEEEARLISVRTKAALAAAKQRGVKLGKPENLTDKARKLGTIRSAEVRRRKSDEWKACIMDTISDILKWGNLPASQIAEELNRKGIPTRRGGKWQATQVKRVMESAA